MNSDDADTADAQAAMRYAMTQAMLGEDIAAADAEIAAVADFDISPSERAPFVRFIEWLNARPAFIAHWRSDPTLENKHYLTFMQGLDACRTGYAASAYHLKRLEGIENAVHVILDRFDFSKSVSRGSVVSIGQTRRWDFEYQAFVMAYRRALDGLAWGLSTYFKAEQSSFNKFSKHLPDYHPGSVASALATICGDYIDHFVFVMGTARGRSLRDRIAHREAVQAGTINLGNFGHRILGGGENLGIPDLNDGRRLAEVLTDRLANLHAFVAEILDGFRSAVTEHEAKVDRSCE